LKTPARVNFRPAICFSQNEKKKGEGVEMILEPGSKILVVHRRLFEKDKGRYFIGTADRCEDGVAKVTGKTWVQDNFNGKFLKKQDVRVKIIPLTSAGLLIYLLPPEVDAEHMDFCLTEKGSLILEDKKHGFRMDLSENCH